MEDINKYILNSEHENSSIYSKYINLELFCLNTFFYDKEKMEQVYNMETTDLNFNVVNNYYKNKINYIRCYIHNLNNLSNLNQLFIDR